MVRKPTLTIITSAVFILCDSLVLPCNLNQASFVYTSVVCHNTAAGQMSATVTRQYESLFDTLGQAIGRITANPSLVAKKRDDPKTVLSRAARLFASSIT